MRHPLAAYRRTDTKLWRMTKACFLAAPLQADHGPAPVDAATEIGHEGIARVGGYAQDTSGDIFIVFSTANAKLALEHAGQLSELKKNEFTQAKDLSMIANSQMDALFEATVQVTEEAIVNAMIAAETMKGVNGNTAYAIPHDRLREVLRKYNRLVK